MKNSVKRISFFSIRLVIGMLLFTGFNLEIKAQEKKMEPSETKEIVSKVYSIKDNFVNMFLIQDGENYIAVDAGNDIKAIENEFKTLQINPDKVIAVLLTHSDGDHVAALKLFKNATVYLSIDEEQMINGTTNRMKNYHNKIDATKYILLADNQTIQILNLKIKGISTPGHTPGSMSYLVSEKYLFVGDAFSLTNGKIDKPNEVYTDDMKTAILSFVKIANLPKAEYVFTAHTGYSSDYKNAVNTQLK